MDDNERDTHFQGFAKLLERELSDWQAKHIATMESGIIYSGAQRAQEMQTIIAQRAYDLAEYILMHHTFWTTGATTLETAKMRVVNGEAIKRIPDLTEWPIP
jgi:hypothetical protein